MAKIITALLLALSAFGFFAQAQTMTPCTPNPSGVCPMYVTEMCVYPKSGEPYMTATNPCFACLDPNVAGTSMSCD